MFFNMRCGLCLALALFEAGVGVALLFMSNDWAGTALGLIGLTPIAFYVVMFNGCLDVYEEKYRSIEGARVAEIFALHRIAGYTTFDVGLRVGLSVLAAVVMFVYAVRRLGVLIDTTSVLLALAAVLVGFCLVRNKKAAQK